MSWAKTWGFMASLPSSCPSPKCVSPSGARDEILPLSPEKWECQPCGKHLYNSPFCEQKENILRPTSISPGEISSSSWHWHLSQTLLSTSNPTRGQQQLFPRCLVSPQRFLQRFSDLRSEGCSSPGVTGNWTGEQEGLNKDVSSRAAPFPYQRKHLWTYKRGKILS